MQFLPLFFLLFLRQTSCLWNVGSFKDAAPLISLTQTFTQMYMNTFTWIAPDAQAHTHKDTQSFRDIPLMQCQNILRFEDYSCMIDVCVCVKDRENIKRSWIHADVSFYFTHKLVRAHEAILWLLLISIHPFTSAFRFRVAGAHPSCHRARAGVHPG